MGTKKDFLDFGFTLHPGLTLVLIAHIGLGVLIAHLYLLGEYRFRIGVTIVVLAFICLRYALQLSSKLFKLREQ